MIDVDGGAPEPALARLRPRWTATRAEHNLARALARIERARRRARAIATAGAVAATVFALAALRRAPVAPHAAAVVAARAATEPPASSPLQLADGSTIALGSPRARVRVASRSPERIDLELADGPATFAIPAREGRAVVVHMARFEVTILAATFTLAPVEERARVDVTSGDVEVRWSGQRAVVRAGSVAILPASAAAASPVAPSTAPGAEALMRDADAARRAGRPATAIPYYRRLLRAFPTDERAPIAAFTLGRVLLTQLDRPAEAADAFATSRRLAPAGALAEAAWAREVEAAARAGEADRARRVARAYLACHADEPRATAVRRAGGLE